MRPDFRHAFEAWLERVTPALSGWHRSLTRPEPPLFRSRAARYAGVGFLFGLVLTLACYLVDYYALYHALPRRLSLAILKGLHEVTPVHFFTDGFAIVLGAVGALLGMLQDRVFFHASHLEDVVAERTEALRRSEERYALAARSANDGLWDWDLLRDRIYYSPRWRQHLGLPDAELSDDPQEWLGRVHPEDVGSVHARIASYLEGGTTSFAAEYRIRHADGTYRWMLARGAAARDSSGRPVRIAGSQSDIDERKKLEEQLMHSALHDTMTGLPNRTLFLDRLRQAFERARQHKNEQSLAIIFLDLDRFKQINDSLGHFLGDRILKEVARRIVQCRDAGWDGTTDLGQSASDHAARFGTVARLGGDEFTVLIEEIRSLQDATAVVSHIQEAFSQPIIVEGHEHFITLSVGIVIGPADYERAEDLLRDADTAMYRAKAGGRGRYEVFNQKMLALVREQFRLETDLHRAVERRQLRLLYQPIVDLETGLPVRFEALLRWEHPDHGLISPDRFIPIAEDTGLIRAMGLWVIREACRQLRRWRDMDRQAGDLGVSVNLSLRQLYDPRFVAEAASAAQEEKLDFRNVQLEITESLLMQHPRAVTRALARLRRRGFTVAIDDFGTGHSSLALLHRLPVDYLKIDRSFVSQLGERESARRIIETILDLAQALELSVIAEGIESPHQLLEIQEVACYLAQGNLFSPPVEAEQIERMVLDRFRFLLPARRRHRSAI
jgi:diguanylate cyclase (GGDEF)-like protein/PAS domain S-box-containing protein